MSKLSRLQQSGLPAVFSMISVTMLLASCANNAITSYPTVMNHGAAQYFNAAAADGEVRTVIIGAPYEGFDVNALSARVTELMAGAYIGLPARFSSAAKPEHYVDTRIVIQFQPPRSTDVGHICDPLETIERSQYSDGEILNAVAAMCMRENALTWTRVSAPMPTTLDDPMFARFIKTITREVIARPDTRHERDNCLQPNC